MVAYQGRDGWDALGDPTRRAIVAALAERVAGDAEGDAPDSCAARASAAASRVCASPYAAKSPFFSAA